MTNDEQLTDMARSSMPFAGLLGLEIVSGDAAEVVARAAWRPEHCTAGGLLHGGFLMAVADSVGALCAFLNLPEGATTSTIESKTNFITGVSEGVITITSNPVHVGRTVVVVQSDIVRQDGKLVSRTTQTQAVLQG